MKIVEFTPKQKVRYVPNHVFGDCNHEDCEDGLVSSVAEKFVFVKFDEQLKKFGWEGTTSKVCLPENLIIRDII